MPLKYSTAVVARSEEGWFIRRRTLADNSLFRLGRGGRRCLLSRGRRGSFRLSRRLLNVAHSFVGQDERIGNDLLVVIENFGEAVPDHLHGENLLHARLEAQESDDLS